MTYVPPGAVKVDTQGSYVPKGAVLVSDPASQKQESSKNILNSVVGFLQPRAEKIVSTIATGLGANSGNPQGALDQASQLNQELLRRAQNEKDPAKKALLLKQAGISSSVISDVAGGRADQLQASSGITDDELKMGNGQFAGSQAMGLAGETAALMAPPLEAVEGAGALAKIGTAATNGGIFGTLIGATNPDAKGVIDRAIGTAKNAAIGTLVAGGMKTGEIGLNKLGQGLLGTSPQAIRRAIKPSITDASDFKQAFGKKVEDVIADKDTQKIKGMGSDELYNYFNGKFLNSVKNKAQKLADSAETFPRDEWVDAIRSVQEALTPENGFIGTEGVQKTLSDAEEALLKNPAEIPAKNAGNIVNSLQDMTSYNSKAGSDVGQKELKGLIKGFNDAIKEKVPGLTEDNMLIQAYRIAKNGVDKSAEREGNKVNQTGIDKILQAFPVLAGVGTGIATRNPLAGLAAIIGTSAPGIIRGSIQSPENQTRLAAWLTNKVPNLAQKEALELANRLIERGLLRKTLPSP